MLTPNQDGTFAARFYLTQVDAGVGCTTPATVVVNLIYSDPWSAAAQPFTFVVALNSSGVTSASTALTLATGPITVANAATGSIMFRAKAGTGIQYSTIYTNGACATQPTYRIVPVLQWF
jgi:hypothetical protein